jgi:hypothetical protein
MGNDDPCYTTFCSNGRPWQTISSHQHSTTPPGDQPSNLQDSEYSVLIPRDDETIIMQPLQNNPLMQPED